MPAIQSREESKTVEMSSIKDKKGINRTVKKTTKITTVCFFTDKNESLTFNGTCDTDGGSVRDWSSEVNQCKNQEENAVMTKYDFLRNRLPRDLPNSLPQSLHDSGIYTSFSGVTAESLNISRDEEDVFARPFFKDTVQLYSAMGKGYLSYDYCEENEQIKLDTNGLEKDASTKFYWCYAQNRSQEYMVLVVPKPLNSGRNEERLCVAHDNKGALTLKSCIVNTGNVQAPDEALFRFTLIPSTTGECKVRLLSSYVADETGVEWYLGAAVNGEAQLRRQVTFEAACYADPGSFFCLYNTGS